MCVGHTHTGKTTFAKQLIKKHKHITLLDSDEVAVFLREKYPHIVSSEYNKSRHAFRYSNLKFTVFKDIYTFSLKTGLSMILSNGNLAKNMRSFIVSHAKKHEYSVILVYFNVPREVIVDRLSKTKKSENVFIQSKSWNEVFARQEKYAEFPPSKRGTIYFEIKNSSDLETVTKEINRLIK